MKELTTLNATPPKEIYGSIIADYELTLGLCELIDNAIDIWHKMGRLKTITIDIELDAVQQRIRVQDNAGGIGENDIVLFMSPGRTSNTGHEDSIGIFGVGSKRALVALSQRIKVRSRKRKKTIFVEINDEWLQEESWDFTVYETDNIDPDTTIIEMDVLRSPIKSSDFEHIENHLSATYANFLHGDKVVINFNQKKIKPIVFDKQWSYPPNYGPKEVELSLTVEGKQVKINIIAGLLREGESTNGEYGVYFYCNNRLIVRAARNYELGYTKGKAGQPNHPSIALARVIVKMSGEAQFMPWNSSKSTINYKHKVFESIRDELIEVVTYYVSLSRRYQGDWPQKVFAYPIGEFKKEKIKTLQEIRSLYRTPLPQVRKKISETIKQKNKELSKRKPWIVGLYEAIIAIDAILKQNLEQKNRFALIMLDSTLEIAFKEYLANELKVNPLGTKRLSHLLQNRTDMITEIQNRVTFISSADWAKIDYYYKMRSNLVHAASTSNVKSDDVENYRKIVEAVLKALFNIKFR